MATLIGFSPLPGPEDCRRRRNGYPFSTIGLDHIVLRVTDLDRMLAFITMYSAAATSVPILSLRPVPVARGAFADRSRDDRGKLGAAGGAAPGAEGRNLDHFALAVDRFDAPAIRAHLAHHGVTVDQSGTRYGAEGEGPSLYIRDPERQSCRTQGHWKENIMNSKTDEPGRMGPDRALCPLHARLRR